MSAFVVVHIVEKDGDVIIGVEPTYNDKSSDVEKYWASAVSAAVDSYIKYVAEEIRKHNEAKIEEQSKQEN